MWAWVVWAVKERGLQRGKRKEKLVQTRQSKLSKLPKGGLQTRLVKLRETPMWTVSHCSEFTKIKTAKCGRAAGLLRQTE